MTWIEAQGRKQPSAKDDGDWELIQSRHSSVSKSWFRAGFFTKEELNEAVLTQEEIGRQQTLEDNSFGSV